MQELTVKDMEELRDDIKMYLDLDRETSTRIQYWFSHISSVLEVVEDVLEVVEDALEGSNSSSNNLP
ncbi:hypothetical protein F2Q69_00037319 [Brassica cretica]|uniref:Splicing factor cactin central domain-containing protein n=1 Tax=Brassica cretica TaxID=69181 RepID=A0A8S9SFE6_BRACR|nr:hypothetical protein F2Q69_00037319 [Brassica cretica]